MNNNTQVNLLKGLSIKFQFLSNKLHYITPFVILTNPNSSLDFPVIF